MPIKKDKVSIRGDRVRLLRERMGLTQRELATRSGVSQPHISTIEKEGVGQVGSGRLYALARALKTNMAFLAGGRSESRAYENPGAHDLSIEEAELVALYRTIQDPVLKGSLLRVARGYVEAEREQGAFRSPDGEAGKPQ